MLQKEHMANSLWTEDSLELWQKLKLERTLSKLAERNLTGNVKTSQEELAVDLLAAEIKRSQLELSTV